MVNGFCMGGGLELALACRYRVALDDPKTRFALPEVMLGIMPAWHGVQWLPKLVGPAAGVRPDADRQDGRCEARQAHRPRRPGGAAAHPREHRAHGDAARPRRAERCRFVQALDAGPLERRSSSRRRESRSRGARGASTIRRPTRSSSCGSKYDGDPFAAAGRSRRSIEALFAHPDHRQPDPHLLPAGAHEGARQGRGLQGARTCTWSAPA